jgi:hypothetical protein
MFDYVYECLKYFLNKILTFINTYTASKKNQNQENPDYYKNLIIENFKTVEGFNDCVVPQLIETYESVGFLPVKESDYLKHEEFFKGIIKEFIRHYKIIDNRIHNYGGGNGWIWDLEDFYSQEGRNIDSHCPMTQTEAPSFVN